MGSRPSGGNPCRFLVGTDRSGASELGWIRRDAADCDLGPAAHRAGEEREIPSLLQQKGQIGGLQHRYLCHFVEKQMPFYIGERDPGAPGERWLGMPK